MATNRHPIQHPRRGRLNHARAMTLRYGEDPRWGAFRSEAEHADCWARHRDRLLAECRPGRRPMSWWRFEAGDLRWPGLDHERSTLYEAGLLGEEERAELIAWWLELFQKAQARDFWLCLGPGRFLEGVSARRQHYAWADIPRALLKEWTGEYRRPRRTLGGEIPPDPISAPTEADPSLTLKSEDPPLSA
jgi:hypothetical protein